MEYLSENTISFYAYWEPDCPVDAAIFLSQNSNIRVKIFGFPDLRVMSCSNYSSDICTLKGIKEGKNK